MPQIKLSLITVIILIGSFGLSAQQFECNETHLQKGIVKTESGLNLRSGPSLNKDVLIAVPKGSEVNLCNVESKTESIAGLEGRWIRASYKGVVGYLFSAYLEIRDCNVAGIKLIFPNDSSVDNFPLKKYCEAYHGVFDISDRPSFKNQYEVKLIEPNDSIFSEEATYSSELSNKKGIPLFLMLGLEIKSKEIQGRLLSKMFFPFESANIWFEQEDGDTPTQYIAYAKGTGVKNDNQKEMSEYKQIKDYELWIKINQKGKENIDLLLFKADLNSWLGGYEGGAWIYWVGHLNDDKIPDIILKTSTSYKGWNYKLLLSDPKSEKKQYKIIDVGEGSSC